MNEESLEQEVTLKSEADLDLPDPEETIRKVDALLSEKQTDKEIPNKENKEKKNSTNTGMTSVIANVMIGIGNKPFLRGEVPGSHGTKECPRFYRNWKVGMVTYEEFTFDHSDIPK